VSMTGPFGNRLLNFGISQETTENVLAHLKDVAVSVNARLSKAMGINPAAAITCIKPEGTTSQKTATSSGAHPWYNDYYLRTVRADKKDPLTQFMIDSGFYWEPDAMAPTETVVFYFPIAAPEGAVTRHDLSAIKHLELWLSYQRFWCEHKPSVTIYVKPEEWAEVGDWVYDHFDEVSGVAFLPHSDHSYVQAPYQDITRDQYEEWTATVPQQVNWGMLSSYELEDSTTSAQDLACIAGACDVVTVGNVA
jgi:ribonucleoside-triphosphate reductase